LMHLHSAVCTYQSNLSFVDASGWVSHTKAYGCVNSSNLCWQIVATESSNGAPTSHVDDPTNEFLGRSGKDYIQSNGINVVAIANSCRDQINDEYHSDLSLAEFVVGKLQLKLAILFCFYQFLHNTDIYIFMFNTCKHPCPHYLHIFIHHQTPIQTSTIICFCQNLQETSN
jgi:hypothetical protein